MNYNIDIKKIANELDFDIDDVEMLLEVFLESADESLQIIEDSIKSEDYESLFKAAHSLKGSAGNLLLVNIANLAREIEVNAKESIQIDYEKKYKELLAMVKEVSN